jgi:hypothetical protein
MEHMYTSDDTESRHSRAEIRDLKQQNRTLLARVQALEEVIEKSNDSIQTLFSRLEALEGDIGKSKGADGDLRSSSDFPVTSPGASNMDIHFPDMTNILDIPNFPNFDRSHFGQSCQSILPPIEPRLPALEDDRKRLLTCPLCGKMFKNKPSLRYVYHGIPLIL